MLEIAALVEGETEKAFVEMQLKPHFAQLGVQVWATLPGRVRKRGGVRSWRSVRDDIIRTLRQRRGRVCTTMFDFYQLPSDWPGRAAAGTASVQQKGPCVEAALHADVAVAAGDDFRSELFVPYVQVHEFEALLFADVHHLAEVLLSRWSGPPFNVEATLRGIVEAFDSPEAIDDGPTTAPSKRIIRIANAYRKRIDGPIVAGRIGLQVLRQRCQHFGDWLSRLERLAKTANEADASPQD